MTKPQDGKYREWLPKAKRNRKIIEQSLAYWNQDVKDSNYYTEEEKISFVIMDVLGHTNEDYEALRAERDKLYEITQMTEKQWKAKVLLDFLEHKDALEKRIENLRAALGFYGAVDSWDKDLMLVGSEKMRDDLEETDYSRFTPGKRAREALTADSEMKGDG